MKYAILLLIIFLIIVFFRFIGNIKKQSELKDKKNNVVDLEKDPESNEYRPKE